MSSKEERILKLEALRRDIAAGTKSIEEGRISDAQPVDIKVIVAARRASRV